MAIMLAKTYQALKAAGAPEDDAIAYENRLPLMLKGPTGCGKTRFLSYMAYKIGQPLITIACHEDLTASDLVGR